MWGELIIGILILIASALVAYLLDKMQLTKTYLLVKLHDEDKSTEL